MEQPRRTVCYGRVSSPAQRPDLKNQPRIVEEFAVAKGIANLEFIEEIGSGLNFKQPKFTALVDSLVAGEQARESTPGDRKAQAWLAQRAKPDWSNEELRDE